jgi:hypothetical protein
MTETISMKQTIKLLGPLILLLVLAGCRAKGTAAPHERLDEGATALRAAFNADVGKVRSLMLVSPT